MIAAKLYNLKDNRKELRIEEVPMPECGEEDILLRVAGCAVCGTDVKKSFLGHTLIKSYPITPGHEFAGRIEKIGKKVNVLVKEKFGRELKEGDRLAVAPVVACEKCSNCLSDRPESCENREDIGFNYDGGFAEYMLIPAKLLKKKISPIYFIPDSVQTEDAILTEPYSCAIHAQKKLIRFGRWDNKNSEFDIIRGIRKGDTVLIIGGGPLGGMHAELAKSSGACVIMAIRSGVKLEVIKNTGAADYYVDISSKEGLKSQLRKITGEEGVDIVITACSSSSAQCEAMEVVKKGGMVSFFGGVPEAQVPFPTNKLHYNGPMVGGTSGASPYHLPVALELMKDKSIKPSRFISHIFSFGLLEKVLLVKGMPNFASIEDIIKIKGERFFDFLDIEPLGIDRALPLKAKAQFLKDSILKAILIPSIKEDVLSSQERGGKERLQTMMNPSGIIDMDGNK